MECMETSSGSCPVQLLVLPLARWLAAGALKAGGTFLVGEHTIMASDLPFVKQVYRCRMSC